MYNALIMYLWLMIRLRAPFCFRFWQQGVGCWWTTVHNVIVQQRAGIHAAEEYFTRGWQGFHSGKNGRLIFSPRQDIASLFIGSENDRAEISGARLKIHQALSRGSFAKYSMGLFPTSYIPPFTVLVSRFRFETPRFAIIGCSSDPITFNPPANRWSFLLEYLADVHGACTSQPRRATYAKKIEWGVRTFVRHLLGSTEKPGETLMKT